MIVLLLTATSFTNTCTNGLFQDKANQKEFEQLINNILLQNMYILSCNDPRKHKNIVERQGKTNHEQKKWNYV